MPGLLSDEFQAGAEIKTSNWTLVPFIHTWRLRAPGNEYGIIWSRPSAVLARDSDGQEHIIPIHDYTMRVIWSLLGASLGAVVLFWVLAKFRLKK